MDRNTRPRHNFWMEQVFDPEEIANIGPRSLDFATAVDLWLSRSSCTILTISRQWFVEMSAARCGALDHGLIFPLKLPWFLFSSADCRFVPGKSFAPSTIIAMKSARRHRTVEWIIWWDMWKMEWNKMNPGKAWKGILQHEKHFQTLSYDATLAEDEVDYAMPLPTENLSDKWVAEAWCRSLCLWQVCFTFNW